MIFDESDDKTIFDYYGIDIMNNKFSYYRWRYLKVSTIWMIYILATDRIA